MKSNKIKLKGKIRTYFNLPLIMTIPLVWINIFIYSENIKDGAVFSGFVLLYFGVMLVAAKRNKPLLINEMITFATQYGSVQKQLLNEFEIPYALVDYNAKVLWVNEQFTEITGKSKNYHKSITSIFPALTKEMLQRSEGQEEVDLTLEDRSYRCSLKRVYFGPIV